MKKWLNSSITAVHEILHSFAYGSDDDGNIEYVSKWDGYDLYLIKKGGEQKPSEINISSIIQVRGENGHKYPSRTGYETWGDHKLKCDEKDCYFSLPYMNLCDLTIEHIQRTDPKSSDQSFKLLIKFKDHAPLRFLVVPDPNYEIDD